MPRRILLLLLCTAVAVGMLECAWASHKVQSTGLISSSDPITFTTDVMAVLARGGCNSGGCHGNKNGKGGFKISLRGQDPEEDYEVLVGDSSGRRINAFDPDSSLLLLKPLGVLPHEGGRRFDRASWEYRILRDWIARNAPRDPAGRPELRQLNVEPLRQLLRGGESHFQIRASAVFSDGSVRDVTRMAVYEPAHPLARVSADGLVTMQEVGETTVIVRYLGQQHPVRVARIRTDPDFRWEGPRAGNPIDREIFTKLQWLRVPVSGPVSDPVFLRRAYLDLTGSLPSASAARAFVADPSRRKRARLIDDLLERPEFAEYWALKWTDLLRVEEKALDRKGVQRFHAWIRDGIAGHKPMDRFVRELVSASGSTYENPAANFYRAHRDPVIRAEAVAQVFLGTRLLCAQCHNHPFDQWSQDDYYNWATVFGRVGYKILENRKRDGLDSHEFIGEQVVFPLRDGEVTNPRTGKPASPRFLGSGPGAAVAAADGVDRLALLADWLTHKDNPRFSRAQANRIWFHLMGRGIVDPMDDFRPTNPPTHPELLDYLASEFTRSGFDLRHVIRLIMNSRAYQTDGAPVPGNDHDFLNYARAIPRRLAAEQLLDAQHQVLEVKPHFAGYPAGLYARQLPGVAAQPRRESGESRADRFLTLFGKPERLLTCECERSSETTLGQAFELITGRNLNDMLTSSGNRIDRMLQGSPNHLRNLEEFYWAALTRPPAAAERSAFEKALAASSSPRRVYEDLAWALVNSKEFLLRY